MAVKCCSRCGKESIASFPNGVKSYVQYGPNITNIKSNVVYLIVQHLIPEGRTKQMLKNLYGLPISTGTIGNICREVSSKMETILTN